jgi:(1->4)-alpha-D-glucan 1-alpha-D-glucosylmutase
VPELAAALAALPVYRTYVEPWSGRVEPAARQALTVLPDRLRSVLLLEEPGHDEFVTRFQQTTGAVMAKGVEDTALYRYVRLLALNEVGADPGRFGLSVDGFHDAAAERARRFPAALLAGTTHDTKRSLDVRARIGALALLADEWAEQALEWRRLNASLRGLGGGPEGRAALYQTLLGAWPIEPSVYRLRGRARREASGTPAVAPDEAWESSVVDFCRALYGHEPSRRFRAVRAPCGSGRRPLLARTAGAPADFPASRTSTAATSSGSRARRPRQSPARRLAADAGPCPGSRPAGR